MIRWEATFSAFCFPSVTVSLFLSHSLYLSLSSTQNLFFFAYFPFFTSNFSAIVYQIEFFLLNIFQSSFNISQTNFFSYNHFICSIILLFYLSFYYCVNIIHFKFLLIFILLFNCSIIKIYYIVIDYFNLI